MLGVRYENWKLVFMEQRTQGTLAVWVDPFVRLRAVKIYNLRTDPFEFADITSNSYWAWMLPNSFFIYGAQALVSQFASTLKEFPAVQTPDIFTIDDALVKMSESGAMAN